VHLHQSQASHQLLQVNHHRSRQCQLEFQVITPLFR
jgi:hypothetical protein